MKRKSLAFFLSLSMLLSLTACNQSQEPNENQSGSDAISSASSEGENSTSKGYASGVGGEWDVPFDNTVTLHTVASEYASAIYPEGDDVTNSEWIRQALERYNIEVVTDWVSDEYDTKINLAIANNDIPDVFHVNDSQLQQLMDAGLLYDLTDVFEECASERVKGYMEADPATFSVGQRDGALYGIPKLHYGFISRPYYIWLRKDWMEEQNFSAPQSMDELENIFLTFMDKYGGYGLAVDKSLDYLNMLAIAWHAYPDMWIESDDGSLVYGSVQPEMKEALATYAEWYQKGILSPDFPSYDFQAMCEAVVSGKVGAQPLQQWWGYNPGVDEVQNQGTDAYFEPYMIPSADGEEVLQGFQYENAGYIVVSKNCENPEAVIKLINFYSYIQVDSIGKESEELITALMDGDRSHIFESFSINPPQEDETNYQLVAEALETGDDSILDGHTGAIGKYESCVDWLNNQTPAALGDYLQMGNGEKTGYAYGLDIIQNEKYILSKLWGAKPQSLLDYGLHIGRLAYRRLYKNYYRN